MLIPAIDLMGGKVVQLVGGAGGAFLHDDVDAWAARFAPYPLIQIIDLDAALGSGDNHALVAGLARRLPCQVGGGIRSIAAAAAMLDAGARRVIVGSALVRHDGPVGRDEVGGRWGPGRRDEVGGHREPAGHDEVDTGFAASLAAAIGRERVVCAVDARRGRVATEGWRGRTSLDPLLMMRTLSPWCDAFLYTHIDGEGLMQGIPLDVVRRLRAGTDRRLIAAGGIATSKEVDALDALGVDAVVGMAVYSGRLEV